jgi:multidrug efflux pump subunit AcrA (membrane-fusion protein)
MHPQIHSDKIGECPICHMRLVKISGASKSEASVQDKSEVRTEVQMTKEQQEILEIHKQPVEKMTLNIHIPVSGRMITSNSVAFQIYESDLRYIKTGLHFKGTTGLNPDMELQGIISAVDSVVDSTSRTIRVIGTVTKGPSQHASETSFRGDINIELLNRLAIPESSVLHTGDGDFVYMMNDAGKLTPKKIILGLKADSFYEVLGGLTTSDTICSGPNFLIDSEAKIRGAN